MGAKRTKLLLSSSMRSLYKACKETYRATSVVEDTGLQQCSSIDKAPMASATCQSDFKSPIQLRAREHAIHLGCPVATLNT
eukprot:2364721-Amphidinium_carterae.1